MLTSWNPATDYKVAKESRWLYSHSYRSSAGHAFRTYARRLVVNLTHRGITMGKPIWKREIIQEELDYLKEWINRDVRSVIIPKGEKHNYQK